MRYYLLQYKELLTIKTTMLLLNSNNSSQKVFIFLYNLKRKHYIEMFPTFTFNSLIPEVETGKDCPLEYLRLQLALLLFFGLQIFCWWTKGTDFLPHQSREWLQGFQKSWTYLKIKFLKFSCTKGFHIGLLLYFLFNIIALPKKESLAFY